MSRLTVAAARDYIVEHCLTATGTGRVGLEVELLTYDAVDRSIRRDPAALAAARLPAGSRITLEPGGQVELSGPPQPGPDAAITAMAADLAALRLTAAVLALDLVPAGFDAARPPARVVRSPRYDAMEAYFDHDGPAGRLMMCNTAALQVNVDLGSPERWHRVHAIGPVLAAAFANSPGSRGTRSVRLSTWWDMDPTRCSPCSGDWVDYVLDARVMMIDFAPVTTGLTFRQWIDAGRPTLDDLAYHLTTLFPPVRPRGWLELRFLDALPDPWWQVAVAVTAALLDDDLDVAGTEPLWREAAEDGLSHPALAAAAVACFEVALAALPAGDTADAAGAYFDRFVSRGRCPADEARAEVR